MLFGKRMTPITRASGLFERVDTHVTRLLLLYSTKILAWMFRLFFTMQVNVYIHWKFKMFKFFTLRNFIKFLITTAYSELFIINYDVMDFFKFSLQYS